MKFEPVARTELASPDAGADGLVWLAAHVCARPVAYLCLSDGATRRFIGCVGVALQQMPAAQFLPALAAAPDHAAFEIADADLAQATGVPGARSLIAQPLAAMGPGWQAALCVIGTRPGALSEAQREALARVAAQLEGQLAQQKLGEDHERKALFLESLLHNTFAAVISISPAGVVGSFNPAAEQMLGYGADEVLGRMNVDQLHLESELLSRAMLLAPLATPDQALWPRLAGLGARGNEVLQEWQLRRKDGTTVPVLLTVAELRDAKRSITGYVGIALDIAERRRLEQLKAEFISTVSHELRTPLTAIRGALGLVCGGAFGAVAEPIQPLLDIANKNSQRLSYLIDDLLDMEKIASGRLQLDLRVQPLLPLIEQALAAAEALAREHQVRLVLEAPADAAQVRVDAERLQQVAGNFLSNAAKFSPAGAEVAVRVSTGHGAVRVEVADSGPGIPAAFRDRIFQKFSQADSSDTRQKGGTGLGLAISKELIERMNGLIGFRSEPGVGTCFHFELPLAGDARPMPELAGQELPDAPRVLVVEDDPDIARLLVLMLNRAGFGAQVAGSALAALECLQQGLYAAMTLDLLLPDQSGISLMRHLRELPALATLPVVVVSAFADDGRHSLKRELAPVDWISKPIDEDRLIQALRRALNQRGARDE